MDTILERTICLCVPEWDGGARQGWEGRGGEGLTDAVLGLEDLIVVLCVLDLGPRLPLVPVVLAAGAAAFALRVLLHPGGPAEQREAGSGGAGGEAGGPTSCTPQCPLKPRAPYL